jgi:hypothetical protein
MLKFLKEPLFQLLILGACIYGGYSSLGGDEHLIVVGEERINAFVSNWQSRMGRAPTAQELDGLIDQYLKEEILFCEAKAMELG